MVQKSGKLWNKQNGVSNLQKQDSGDIVVDLYVTEGIREVMGAGTSIIDAVKAKRSMMLQ